MKTEVILKRPFMGLEVRQKSKSSMFSATDLVNIVNLERRLLSKPLFNFSAFLKKKSTIEFIKELEKDNDNVIVRSKGKNSSTWVHPFLFIDIALTCDPKLKIEVYKWLYDELLKNRNDSGDSYKIMCGSLFERTTEKNKFHKKIAKLSILIKSEVNVKDWETATSEQLKLRDKIHENISLLCSVMKNTHEAIRIAILKSKEQLNNET